MLKVTYIITLISLTLLISLIDRSKKLNDKINSIEKMLMVHIKNLSEESEYDEYDVQAFSKFTAFRVALLDDGRGKYMVQYRNPSDTKWKTCRCEDSYDEAYAEMKKIMEKIKNEEI